jgi:hypothetical protein
MHTKFWLENLERRGHLGELGIDERTVLTYEGANLIHLAQESDQWWAVVNMVMNLWVP